MRLTVKKVENAKPKEKLYRLVDGHGLCLEVPPKGRKRWKYRYKLNGRDDTVSIGLFPAMTLAEARQIHSELYKVRASGLCPKGYYKDQKNKASDKDSFEAVTREWFAKFKHKWVERTGKRKMRRLEGHVFPLIGAIPIDQVDAPQIRRVLLRLESLDKLHTAHRVKNIIGEVMRYAVAMGLIIHNPVPDLAGVLPPTKEKHRASITDPQGIGGLLRAIDEYSGSPVTRCALKLAALTFVRPGELRHAEWSEIDYEAEEWRIPAEKMKMRRPHVVPLSRQAIEALKAVELVTGHGRFVFPSERSSARPMSNNTVNAALRRMGLCRASAGTKEDDASLGRLSGRLKRERQGRSVQSEKRVIPFSRPSRGPYTLGESPGLPPGLDVALSGDGLGRAYAFLF